MPALKYLGYSPASFLLHWYSVGEFDRTEYTKKERILKERSGLYFLSALVKFAYFLYQFACQHCEFPCSFILFAVRDEKFLVYSIGGARVPLVAEKESDDTENRTRIFPFCLVLFCY